MSTVSVTVGAPASTGRSVTEQGDLVIAIVGSGGDGVITAGDMLAQSAAMEGIYCMVTKSYGPQIRGGESSCRLRLAPHPVQSQGDHVDVLVVFNWADFVMFREEYVLRDGAVIIVADEKDLDRDTWPIDPPNLAGVHHFPFKSTAKDVAGTALAKNVVLLGVLGEMFNLPMEGIRRGLKKKFARKKPVILEGNLKALEAGRELVAALDRSDDLRIDAPADAVEQVLMTGNEAFGFGATYAGCRFYSGYPITPSSDLMEYLSRELPRFGGICMQTEDEISAVCMAIGASYGGAKSMTSTSGPGYSLMQEAIGLATITETPLVIVNVMRGGPSTGLPTGTEQSDLMQAMWGSHGDCPRVILAPGDVEDCFDVAVEAFYIAEKYQMVVIVLSDYFLSQRKESMAADGIIDRDDGFVLTTDRLLPTEAQFASGEYKRYELGLSDGVSPMALPGMEEYIYTLSGIEHNEYGQPSTGQEMHRLQTEKRYHKMEAIAADPELSFLRTYGPDDAAFGIMCWGSTKGAVKEAVMRINAEDGPKVRMISPQMLLPIDRDRYQAIFQPLDCCLFVEMNHSRMYYKFLRGHLDSDLSVHAHFLKRGGPLPFSVGEVDGAIRAMLEQEASA